MGLQYFLAKGTATVINRPDNDPKNPPGRIILEIWGLESFISVDILLLNAFLNLTNFLKFFCLVVSNSWGRSFPSIILKLILKVDPAFYNSSF